jgi:cytochrome c553
MKKIVIATSLLVASVAFAGSYDKCATCHGVNGEKAALGKSKVIKDMTKADFVSALKGYQDGTYGGASKGLMAAQVKGMNEATMNEIADTIIK